MAILNGVQLHDVRIFVAHVEISFIFRLLVWQMLEEQTTSWTHLAAGLNQSLLFQLKPLTLQHSVLPQRQSGKAQSQEEQQQLLCFAMPLSPLTLTKTKWRLVLWCSRLSHFFFIFKFGILWSFTREFCVCTFLSVEALKTVAGKMQCSCCYEEPYCVGSDQ